jgi:hypothetical protein
MEKNTDSGEERTMSEYISPTDVAKVARRELRKAFAGTKFYVRTSKYAGGSSVRVRWVDGPTTDEVEAIVGWMHGMTFDGMTDSSSYHDSVLFGEKVHFGNSFMFLNREISVDLFRSAVAVVAADWGGNVNKFTIEVTDWNESTNTAYFAGYETHGVINTMEVQRLVGDVLRETSV